MPSALETLVKILKLEQDTGYQNKAVISGLQSYATHWGSEAHIQAKKPEHHSLVDELVGLLTDYGGLESIGERHDAIKYMLGRITGRIPPVQPVRSASEQTTAPPVQMTLNTPATEAVPPAKTSTDRPPLERPAPVKQPPATFVVDEQPSVERKAQRDPRVAPPDRAPDRVPERSAVVPSEPDVIEDEPEAAAVVEISQYISVEMTIQLPDAVELSESSDEPELPPTIRRSEPPRRAEPPRPNRRRRGSRDHQAEMEAWNALKTPVTAIEGVGPKIAEKLAPLELNTVEDVLYYFPRRYDDYTQMLPLGKLKVGMMVTVIGEVRNAIVIKGKRGQEILNVTIADGTGTLTASFFGQPYLRSKFERGTQVVFSGKIDSFLGRQTMNQPEWESIDHEALHTRAIVPVYPLTKGMSAHMIRKIAHSAVERWLPTLPDYMPTPVLERVDLPDLNWALRQMHFPDNFETLEAAERRLAFDELILLQLGVLQTRRDWEARPSAPLVVGDGLLEGFNDSLPYALTGAQLRAIQAIREDLAHMKPMNRLLQGDVGAGKTVVAAMAMAIAVGAGYQAALLAPTSILAEQHYKSISKLIAASPNGDQINVKLLTSATSAQERAETLWGLGEGSVNIIIGTHALLEADVNFWRLGLAIIDEQHRFGVRQRGILRGKGTNPHVLIMTATPIPRTLALTMYADLDLTILDEMPPGRSPIDTRILYAKERESAYRFIDVHINNGRQAFIVYPLVEASESETMSEVRSATEEFERLRTTVFPKHRLGLLHGRMSGADKDEVMSAFSRHELDILVSTSVVEVGIDVPNASVILIESANRFGLAQLHQFRGRVGRGQHPSFCLLIPDDHDMDNPRLRAMESTTDGFKLAEMDWEQRGAGDLLGTQQSGGAARLGEFMDVRTVEVAQVEARTLYADDPMLTLPEHALLHERLRQRYGKRNQDADVS